MIDPNLFRWIELSINTFFDANKGDYSLYFEGQEVLFQTSSVVNPATSLSTVPPAVNLQSWAELHVSTFDIDEVTQGNFESEMILTVMATAKFNLDNTLLLTTSGYFANLMSGCIPIKRYGNQDGDDQSFIGSLAPRGKMRTTNWGSVQLSLTEGPLRVKQQSLEQLYKLSI